MRILPVAPLSPLRNKTLSTSTFLVVTSFLLIALMAGSTVLPVANALHPQETIVRVEYANNCMPDASIDPHLCDATLSDLSQTKVQDNLAPDSAIGAATGGTLVSTDPLIKFRDAVVDSVWIAGPGPTGGGQTTSTECVFRDNDGNGIFASATDTVILAGSGAGACTGIAAIKSDPKIKFLDTAPVNGVRDATERVFYDFNDDGVIEIGTISFFTDIVLYNAVNVFAFQVLVRYDPLLLNVRLFNIGTAFSDVGGSGFPSIANLAGTAGFGATLVDVGSTVNHPGPIQLVRINWRVMNEGASDIHLVTDIEDEDFGIQLLDAETPGRNILYDSEDGFVSTMTSISALPNPEFTFSPANPISAGGSVDFDASQASLNVDTFAWDFGDGTTAAGATVSHLFANACDPAMRPRPIGPGGCYRVFLRGSNPAGSATSTKIAIVQVVAQPLVVTVACPDAGLTAGKPFTCDVSATGGTPPYTGTGPQPATFPVKGTYTATFTVTDSAANSASGSDAVNISAQPLVVSVACTDGTAGKPITCDVSASGGTSPYTGTGTFSQTFSVKGTYTVSFDVTDANDATATGSDTVSIAAQPLVVSVVCSDGTAGKPISCDVSATGGTAPYTGTGTFSRTFAVKGTYTVSFDVTDSNGATVAGSDSVVIAPQPLVVTVVCSDGTVGKPITCDVSASGGTGPYTGSGTFTETFPVKGTYTVSFDVTDSNGATATGSDSVAIAAQPVVVSVDCPGVGLTAGKPFTCEVSATGGTSPYSGTGTQTVVFPVKGTYTVTFTVTDANGESASGSDSVTISAQPLVATAVCPDSGLTEDKPFDCEVSATGGTAPYTGTGVFSQTFTEPGTYTVTFTVTDANGGSITASDTVEIAPQPPGELIVTVTCPATGLTAGKPFQCDVSATGGSPPYTGTGLQTVSFPTKGTYTASFTVTDSVGGSATGSDTVTIGAQPLVVTVACPDTGLTAGKPFTCDVSATGGTSPYSGTGSQSATLPVKGTHVVTFTVTDANGDSASGSDTVVIEPQPLVVTVVCPDSGLTAGKPFTCDVSATGGTAPYTGTGSFTQTFAGPGTYTVSFTVTDVNDDSASGSDIVEIAPQPPGALIVIVACPDSGLTAGKPFQCDVSATGGTPPYTGTGSQAVTFPVKGTYTVTFTVTDSADVSATGSDSVIISAQPLIVNVACPDAGLMAGKPFVCVVSATGGTAPYTGAGELATSVPTKGTHTVTFAVTDANDESASGFDIVTVDQQPLAADFTVPTVTAGKPATLTAILSGGTSPYIVHWDLDADGTFDHAGEEFTVTFPVKGTTMVRLHIIDDNGSDAEVTHEITVDPQPLVVSVECPFALTAGKPFSCSVTATGGTGPYSGTGLKETIYPVKGTYTISFTATDANGEAATGSTTITIDPQPLVAEFVFPSEGGTGEPLTFEASASGGTAPYLFSWNFGDGISGTGSSASHTYSVKGSYFVTLTVTDANGATAQVQHVVVVLPQILVAVFSASPSPGTVGEPVTFTASVNGGTLPYVYEWSFGDGSTGTGNPASHTYASAGQVTVLLVVTDANDAVAAASLDLMIEPSAVAAVLLTFDGCDVDSFEDGVGELNVFINGVPVVDIPAGLHGLTGSGEYTPYDSVCINFGPFDITSHIQQGANTLVFLNPLDSHFSQIKNIRVVQDGTVLLLDTRIRSNGPGDPEVLTFSVPPLALTSFGLVQPAAFETERVTFTATFTGGTAPFRCTFSFGDGDSKTVATNTHECSASHTYWSDRLRTATVRVRGSTLADNVQAQMLVRVEPQPGCAEVDDDDDGDDDGDNGDDCLSWQNVIDLGEEQTFRVRLTNPASVSVLIRLDFTVTRPDGSKESFISPSFLLSPGQTLTGLSFNYLPSGGMGNYCFKAPLRYGVDTNDNGVLENSELLGNRSAESGCFTVVSVAVVAAPSALFLGAMLIPKSRNSIIRYLRPKKHE